MDRRRFLLTSLAGALVAPLGVEAQPAGRIPTIGFVQPVAGHPGAEAFRAGLREFGYLDGSNICIDSRVATKPADLSSVSRELAHLDIDVIVTWGTPQALAAKAATRTIPIVTMTGDPVHSGLIESLARPAGNVTGLAILTEEVEPKGLMLLREAAPSASRIGVLFIPVNPVWIATLKRLAELSGTWGGGIVALEVHDAGDLDRAFSAARRQGAGALLVLREALFTVHRARLVALAQHHRLPAMYGLREFVDSGGLMSYGPNISDTLRRAAYYVDRILRGARPGDLPVEQPTKFDLVINLKTAKTLGLTIPPSLLARADQIIE